MSESNLNNFHIRPVGSAKSTARWGINELGRSMLCASMQPYGCRIPGGATDTTEVPGLGAAQTQAVNPCPEPLRRSLELWKFRRINTAAIGAR